MITSRQLHVGTAPVPPIEAVDNLDINGYESVSSAFVNALTDKYSHDKRALNSSEKHENMFMEGAERDERRFRSYVNQTIHFLKSVGALKPGKKVDKVELWSNFISMEPFYEGVACSLQSALTKKYYRRVYDEMSKGKIYSYYPLTEIKEAVTYVMEYFKKEGLLVNVEDVLKNESTKKWISDHINFCKTHKEEIEQKEKEWQEGYERELRETEEIMKDIKGSKH
jgi:hypothetical protein